MPDDNARVTIRLSPRTSNVEPTRSMNLVIEDVASGLVIISVQLDAAAVMQMISSQAVGDVDGIPAFVNPRPERLRKTQAHISRLLPSYPPQEWRDRHAPVEMVATVWKERLEEWARFACETTRGDHYRLLEHNNGKTSVTIRAYLPDATSASSWTKVMQVALNEIPSPQVLDAPSK